MPNSVVFALSLACACHTKRVFTPRRSANRQKSSVQFDSQLDSETAIADLLVGSNHRLWADRSLTYAAILMIAFVYCPLLALAAALPVTDALKAQSATSVLKQQHLQAGAAVHGSAPPEEAGSFRLANQRPSVEQQEWYVGLLTPCIEPGLQLVQLQLRGPDRTASQLVFILGIVFSMVFLSWCFLYFLSEKTGNRIGISRSRAKILSLCLSLAACSWGMTVSNKHLMMTLHSPFLVCTVQQSISTVAAIIFAGGKFKFDRESILRWLIVPVLLFGQILSSLFTMQYLTLSMLMLVRNLGPLVTLPFEVVALPAPSRPVVTVPTVLALCLVLASAGAYFEGMHVSTRGLVFATLNLFLAVADVVVRRRLLTTECESMPTTTCMFLNNAISIGPAFLLTLAQGEIAAVEQMDVSTETLLLLPISGCIASGISYFGLALQREIAATSYMVFENVIRMAEVLAGVALFNDPFRWPSQVIGISVSFAGSIWYAKDQLDNKAEIESEYDAEDTDTNAFETHKVGH